VTGSVSKVFANEKNSLFLDTGRTLYGCGQNTYGQLGIGNTTQQNVPIEVSGNVDYVAAGEEHTLMASHFISNFYHPFSCGRNNDGQLGLGDTTSRYLPTRITGQGNQLVNGVSIDGISAGAGYSLFTKYSSNNPTSYHCGSYYNIAGEPVRLWPTQETGNIRQAAAGITSAVYLTDNNTTLGAGTVTGSLFGIGQNGWGQLGLGPSIAVAPDPTYVTGTRYLDFSSVSAGSNSSFFLLEDGTFYSCGSNYDGVLGQGENFLSTNPNNLPTLTGILSSDIVSREGGHEVGLILTAGGDVYSCGESPQYPGGYGTLGLGPQEEARRPTYVTGDVKAISAGHSVSLFLKNDGYAYGCGRVHSLGLNPSDFPGHVRRPTVISGDVAAISAGLLNSFFLSTAGSVYVQGDNQFKQSAFASAVVPGWSPQHVTSGPAGFDGNITGISAGSHTLFLKNDGTLYSCGQNNAGQLGLGMVGPVGGRYQPTEVTTSYSGPAFTDVSQAEIGSYHSVILKTDGKAYTFGTGGQGQLGDGTTVDKWSPTYVTGASNPVAKVTAASFRTTFLNHSNDAYSCGQYPLGVPGTSSAFHYVPTYISGNITGIGSATQDQNSFVDLSGELYVLGKEPGCSLGLGNDPAAGPITVYHSTRVPGPYSSFLPIVKIVSNSIASLFLTADGDCYSCGFYQNGNLGRLNYDLDPPGYGRTYYPQFVTGSVVDINASEGMCMGLVGSDGYAYAYGYNSAGMMGLGTAAKNTAVWLPTRISGNVASISFGGSHAAYLTPGGDIYAAGRNTQGQLGDGTTTERTSPVRVSGNSTGVYCGSNYSIFTSKDGNVYSCGFNNVGQLGLGDNTDRHLPTKIIIP
jgi:alpha-tubulin suppressor-like RCC1 family protein